MASEVTVRKCTQGFYIYTPRMMQDGKVVEATFAESTRPAMIQRVLKCLGIEPAECYLESSNAKLAPHRWVDDSGEPFAIPGCSTGSCGVDD